MLNPAAGLRKSAKWTWRRDRRPERRGGAGCRYELESTALAAWAGWRCAPQWSALKLASCISTSSRATLILPSPARIRQRPWSLARAACCRCAPAQRERGNHCLQQLRRPGQSVMGRAGRRVARNSRFRGSSAGLGRFRERFTFRDRRWTLDHDRRRYSGQNYRLVRQRMGLRHRLVELAAKVASSLPVAKGVAAAK